jgi:hypothetical protein
LPDAQDTEGGARDDRPARAQASGALSERRWSFAAGACLVAAAALFVAVGAEAAFVAAVLGAVAWFWDQRNRIRASVIEDEHSGEGRDEFEEFDDSEGGRGAGGE